MKFQITLTTGYTNQIEAATKADARMIANQADLDSKNGMDMIDAGFERTERVEMVQVEEVVKTFVNYYGKHYIFTGTGATARKEVEDIQNLRRNVTASEALAAGKMSSLTMTIVA